MNRKYWIIGGIVGGVLLATYLYIKKQQRESGFYDGNNAPIDPSGESTVSGITSAQPMSPDENYKNVQLNLGVKAPSGNGFSVKFNSAKNSASFYNNNRFAIFNNKGQLMFKGAYQQGGKSLKGDNGKIAVSGSVWGNLNSIVK